MFSVPNLNLGSIDAYNYKGRNEKEFLSRIFLRDSFLESIVEERKYFLIGEKGTGKTSYAVLLNNSDYHNTKSSVRTVTSTDYIKFIRLKEQGHLTVSHYVDAWKVILLLLSAHHLSEREGAQVLQFTKFANLKAAIDEYYNSAFAPEVVNALELVENSEVAASVMAKHAKLGGKIADKLTEHKQTVQTNLLSLERYMKESISSLKLASNHIVFIDGIDIRPPGIEFATYIECIRGLAQAAWSLNTDVFANIRDSKGRIKIVLLLRPDILDALGYQNLNAKVRDNGIILDWRTTYRDYRTSRIFQLMDGILGKQQNDAKPNFGEAWDHYFPYQVENLWEPDKLDNAFIGFLRYSFYRPRDILEYLIIMQDYVRQHDPGKHVFTLQSFKASQAQYSDYLLGEVRDHLAFYYSIADFDEVAGFFQFLKGANTFNWSEFKNAYSEYKKRIAHKNIVVADLKEGPERFLQLLYSLNVLGFDERPEGSSFVFVHWCFRDRTPVVLNPKIQAGLDYGKRRPAYFVHPGLARALRVGGKGPKTGSGKKVGDWHPLGVE
jgi:hypothetical protein